MSTGGDFGDNFSGKVDKVGGVGVLLVVGDHSADDEVAEAFVGWSDAGGRYRKRPTGFWKVLKAMLQDGSIVMVMSMKLTLRRGVPICVLVWPQVIYWRPPKGRAATYFFSICRFGGTMFPFVGW